MKNNQLEIFEIATEYIEKGFSIIPVGQDKKPLVAWKIHQEKKADDSDISRWSKQFPNMNIGIVTGEVSNITVIDIDTKSGEANKILSKFPKTYTVKTPSGGFHLYYKYQKGFTVSANAYPEFPYVDIRGDSGYVVAPPSKTGLGAYEVIVNMEIQDFPVKMFPKSKPKKTIKEVTSASKGNRNDSIASFIGLLLQSTKEDQWETEVFPAAQRTNKTYIPQLPDHEIRTVFESIVRKEKERRADLIISPMQSLDGEEIPATKVKLRRNGANTPYKDMANVVAVLEQHPFYKGTLRYNSFAYEIEYNGKNIDDNDTLKIQYFLQTEAGLPGITDTTVNAAINHIADKYQYDEAQDWLKTLKWDGVERLDGWLISTTNVEDNPYNRGVGAQWFKGMIDRIMKPGCIFDYMLVLVGGQGIGKTSLFRILGDQWYKPFTGSVDNKDFYIQLRRTIIMDLDEGASMYKADAIKLKSIVTQTHDEFRAPYGRLAKKYPRRFVFSMTTNDLEPFRDATGNRRYWPVDLPSKKINFKWIEDNRIQLFAEGYHNFLNKIAVSQVPEDVALQIQEDHMSDDSWTELVTSEVMKSADYRRGYEFYSTSIPEVFSAIFPNESIVRLDKKHEMRISTIFRKYLGLEKKRTMTDGEQKNRWFIIDIKKKELQKENLPIPEGSVDLFDDPEREEF